MFAVGTVGVGALGHEGVEEVVPPSTGGLIPPLRPVKVQVTFAPGRRQALVATQDHLPHNPALDYNVGKANPENIYCKLSLPHNTNDCDPSQVVDPCYLHHRFHRLLIEENGRVLLFALSAE
jgi:hypothetical protein